MYTQTSFIMNTRHAIRPLMLNWSDYLTLNQEGVPERRNLKDWYTSDPCAVISAIGKDGVYLTRSVYWRFMTKSRQCDC